METAQSSVSTFAPYMMYVAIGAVVLAVIFLVLWLRARSGGGGEVQQELRTAQNEVALLRGDLVQAKQEHTNEVQKLGKELETLRAVAGGQVPPELEQWKQRALDLEKRLDTENARHREEIEKVVSAMGEGSADSTMISPGGVKGRIDTMEQELNETKKALADANSRYERDFKDLQERLGAEKASALSSQARRLNAEIEKLRGTTEAAPAIPSIDGPDPHPDVPDSAKFPYLEVVAGAGQGTRYFLPYDMATIGRADTNTVTVQEQMASRVHAEVQFDGVDFAVADRNSTNGTTLNEEIIETAPLKFGDQIGIGESRYRFSCEAFDHAQSEPANAIKAYEAMVAISPNCRLTLQNLKELLDRDGSKADEAGQVAARLQWLDSGRLSRAS